ncbi:MAG: hypothetical protein WCD35_08270, partial [Mycobacteriales bacterium]
LGARLARATELASGSRLHPTQRQLLRERMDALSSQAWTTYAVEQRAFVQEAPALARQLREVAVPAVVAIGTRDVVVAPRAQRDLARLLGAEVLEHEGGHLVQLEAPGVAARAIRRAVELASSGRPEPAR